MVEFVMTMTTIKTIHFFLLEDQLCGFSASLGSQVTIVCGVVSSSEDVAVSSCVMPGVSASSCLRLSVASW